MVPRDELSVVPSNLGETTVYLAQLYRGPPCLCDAVPSLPGSLTLSAFPSCWVTVQQEEKASNLLQTSLLSLILTTRGSQLIPIQY